MPQHTSQFAPITTSLTTRRTDERLPEEKITAFENLNETLRDPFTGTGITNIIQTLLDQLVPGEEAAEQRQADEFRKAGAISDASRGVASSRLKEGFQRARGGVASAALLDFFNSLVRGRTGALTGIPSLSSSESRSESFGFAPPVQRFGVTRGSQPSIESTTATAGQRFQDLLGLVQPRTPAPAAAPTVRGGGGAGTQAFARFNQPSAVSFGPSAGGASRPGADVPGFRGSGTPEDPFTNL